MEEEGAEAKPKESRLYRQGLSYRTMSADNTVCHNSDIGRLPAGVVIIKLPFSGHPEIIDVVSGTHASGSFLAYLAFNKYVLDTPLEVPLPQFSYCCMFHLIQMKMKDAKYPFLLSDMAPTPHVLRPD